MGRWAGRQTVGVRVGERESLSRCCLFAQSVKRSARTMNVGSECVCSPPPLLALKENFLSASGRPGRGTNIRYLYIYIYMFVCAGIWR